ncbi:MAG: N-6 DNA methylase [Gemmatimonadota bacterium]|nr:MAG: N-6 DNA methylase [Gemmatimonadota bacterium]
MARWQGFTVIATDSPVPRQDARDLARSLSRVSARALAAAIGPPRELALAAPRFGQSGTTKVLVISLDSPSQFALQQLERLSPDPSSSALAHALRVADVLSSEEVSERFFTAFRVILARMTASVTVHASVADRRMVSLLALNRILFLYFVQSKGWLNGQSDFLVRLLDESLASDSHFHRTALQPLFFGTLNRPACSRNKHPAFGAIPYLNGGLFEPHLTERRIGPVYFPNELWRDAFDCVFERFRFCVNEDSEVDAVAPDMLGRAFERLMEREERHASGTFYTPESVVRQVVNAAIESALLKYLSPDLARSVVERSEMAPQHLRSCRSSLKRLRVLDPAVGSGAFLLGALESLAEMRANTMKRPRAVESSRLRRGILRENLMGVDLNPVAVRIAELRLWLAVIAHDATSDIAHITPLPNLDGVVRQGDTLLDPLSAAQSLNPIGHNVMARAALSVRSARKAVFDTCGRDFRTSSRNLRIAETRMAHKLIDYALGGVDRAIKDLTCTAVSKDLFGKRTGLSPAQRKRHLALKQVHDELQRAHTRVADGELPFFAFQVHAPDVMAHGGFDVVVGNPPWVRAERLPASRRKALFERFSWWRSSGATGFAHLPDLSVAFLQRCIELAAPGGAVGLLLPSKITSAAYAETARRALVRETSIAYLHRVGKRDAARFKATTYPLAIVVRKESPNDTTALRLDFAGERSLLQHRLDAPGSWILLPARARSALDELLSSGTALGRVCPPMLGVKTGANDVFVGELLEAVGEFAMVRFGAHRAVVERMMLRPALRGRDIRPFSTVRNRVLLWTHDERGRPLRTLPRKAARYLKRHADRLRSRKDYRSGPLWTVFRVGGAVSNHRVVWSDIARCPRAVALDETDSQEAIPLNTCYVVAAPDGEVALAIAATLNSTWARALSIASADEARGGYRRINARVAARLPIPSASTKRTELAQLSLSCHKRENVDTDQLDDAVADALGLSAPARSRLRSLASH